MQVTTKTSFLGLIFAISALCAVTTPVKSESLPSPSTDLGIEQRLARLTAALQQRDSQFPSHSQHPNDSAIAGWGNVRGGGGFANNRGGGGFVNNRGGGGGFANSGGGGGFINNRWGDGGSFYNRY